MLVINFADCRVELITPSGIQQSQKTISKKDCPTMQYHNHPLKRPIKKSPLPGIEPGSPA